MYYLSCGDKLRRKTNFHPPFGGGYNAAENEALAAEHLRILTFTNYAGKSVYFVYYVRFVYNFLILTFERFKNFTFEIKTVRTKQTISNIVRRSFMKKTARSDTLL